MKELLEFIKQHPVSDIVLNRKLDGIFCHVAYFEDNVSYSRCFQIIDFEEAKKYFSEHYKIDTSFVGDWIWFVPFKDV